MPVEVNPSRTYSVSSMKRNRLRDLDMDEVSLVKRGANQHADILFHKADEEPMNAIQRLSKSLREMFTAVTDDEEVLAKVDSSLEEFEAALEEPVTKETVADEEKPIAKETIPGEGKTTPAHPGGKEGSKVRQVKAKRTTQHGDAMAERETDVGEDDGIDKNANKGTTMAKTDEDVLKSLPEEAQALIRKQADDITAAEERIAKMEDERATEQAVVLAKTMLGDLPGEAAALADILKVLTPDEQAVLKGILGAANEAAKVNKVLEEVGRRGMPIRKNGAKLDTAAADIRKINPALSVEQAIAKALDVNPSLYEESLTPA